MEYAKKFLGVAAFAALFIGFRVYNFNKAEKDVRTKLVELCENDSECLAVVEKNFDECWDANSDAGGRRRGMKVNSDGLVDCLNTKAGVEYFATTEE